MRVQGWSQEARAQVLAQALRIGALLTLGRCLIYTMCGAGSRWWESKPSRFLANTLFMNSVPGTGDMASGEPVQALLPQVLESSQER